MDRYPHEQNNKQSSAAAANGTSSQDYEAKLEMFLQSLSPGYSMQSSAEAAHDTSSQDDETDTEKYFKSFPPGDSMQSSASAANGTTSQDDETDVEKYLKSFPPGYSMQSSAAAANGTSSEDDETDIEKYFKTFPPGYRFAPTDDELINDYLMNKVNNKPLPANRIGEVNLYSKDPIRLTEENKPITETEWYFFTHRDKKYPNGSRPNRGVPKDQGYWKPTGTDKAIPHDSKHPVGCKKTLDFYVGKHPYGEKTDWKMHEYKVIDNNVNNSQNNGRPKDGMTLDDWVLCRIYKKKQKIGGDEASTNGTQPPNVNVLQMYESYNLLDGNNDTEFEDQNPNVSQPSVNVSQNNEAANLMAGNNNIDFEDQNRNASQPSVNVSQNNEVASNLMAGNNNIDFEDQNASQPSVYVSQNNEEASNLMAGNNRIEDQNLNASQPFVYISQNNEEAFNLMVGNNSIEFEDHNWNAFQPTPNQGPMHEEPGTFQPYSTDSLPLYQIEDSSWEDIDLAALDTQSSPKGT